MDRSEFTHGIIYMRATFADYDGCRQRASSTGIGRKCTAVAPQARGHPHGEPEDTERMRFTAVDGPPLKVAERRGPDPDLSFASRRRR